MQDDCTTNPPESTQVDTPDITLSPFYQSAVNSITQPDKLVFVSRYLVAKWLPDLGVNAFALLCFLRRRCYSNRKTGEMRDEIQVALPDIAKGCQLSVSTVRRELQNNTHLRRFVTVRRELAYDKERGGYRKAENTYHVSMDDPLHPSDDGLLQERIREAQELREKGEDDPKERARQRAETTIHQNDTSQDYRYPRTKSGASKLTDIPTKMTPTPVKMKSDTLQNDASLIDYSCLPETTLKTTETTAASPPAPAARVCISSSQETEKAEEKEPVIVNLPEKPTKDDLRAEVRRCGLYAVQVKVWDCYAEATGSGAPVLGLRAIEWLERKHWLTNWGWQI